MKKNNLSCLVEKWPSSLVARHQVGLFTGGVINPRTLANIDSQGNGPKRFILKNRVVYYASDLVAWLEQYLEEK